MDEHTDIPSIIWTSSAIITSLVVAILLFVVFYQNRFLKLKKSESQLLLETALNSEIAERHRIAADIHDSITGDIGAIRNYMAILMESEADPQKRLIYDSVKDLADEVFKNTREISYKLMPPLLESKGFVPALRNLTARLSKVSKVNFRLKVIDESFWLPPDAGYEIFRVIQELTTNINKHGEAANCFIELNIINSSKIILLHDDGKPFDFEASKNTSVGIGLKNVESRLKAVGAQLVQQEIQSGNSLKIII